MIRYFRLRGVAYKAVLIPKRDLERLAHIDHDQRVMFVDDTFTPTELRTLILSTQLHDPTRRQGEKEVA